MPLMPLMPVRILFLQLITDPACSVVFEAAGPVRHARQSGCRTRRLCWSSQPGN
jgi:hypothetical protein